MIIAKHHHYHTVITNPDHKLLIIDKWDVVTALCSFTIKAQRHAENDWERSSCTSDGRICSFLCAITV